MSDSWSSMPENTALVARTAKFNLLLRFSFAEFDTELQTPESDGLLTETDDKQA